MYVVPYTGNSTFFPVSKQQSCSTYNKSGLLFLHGMLRIYAIKKRVEARYTSRGKVREIVGLSATMNKIGCPTYLSNTKEYLIFAAA